MPTKYLLLTRQDLKFPPIPANNTGNPSPAQGRKPAPMNAQTTQLAQQIAKDMARELAKQMLAQSARLSPTLSPEQSRARQNTAQIAAAWQAQSALAQNSWLTLAQTINAREGRFGNKALNGYRAFFLLNSNLLTSGQPLLTQAPNDVTPPAGLPPMLLTATRAGAATDNAPNAGSFTLNIVSPALTGLFQVWGAKPTLADKVIRPAHDFTLLGAKSDLGGLVDIADLYLAKFDAPNTDSKVAIQIVPLSPEGFKGAPLLLTAVAQAATLAKPVHAGSDTLLKAA